MPNMFSSGTGANNTSTLPTLQPAIKDREEIKKMQGKSQVIKGFKKKLEKFDDPSKHGRPSYLNWKGFQEEHVASSVIFIFRWLPGQNLSLSILMATRTCMAETSYSKSFSSAGNISQFQF